MQSFRANYCSVEKDSKDKRGVAAGQAAADIVKLQADIMEEGSEL